MNAYITSFRSDFNLFKAENIGQVKGFGNRLETAQGKGSVILTDSADNRETLHNVAFVPES